MGKKEIYTKANKLVCQTGTRKPEAIAREAGIKIYEEPAFNKLLGMYTYRWKHRMIFLNPQMEDAVRQMVIAHELGHDALHRELAKEGLKEFSLFHIEDQTEYEANAFAAHILLEDDKIIEIANAEYDAVQASRILDVDINLLMIKLKEMNQMGFHFRVPFETDRKFLGKIDGMTNQCFHQ